LRFLYSLLTQGNVVRNICVALPIFVHVIFNGIHPQLPSFHCRCALWPIAGCSLKWCVKITLAAAVRHFGQI